MDLYYNQQSVVCFVGHPVYFPSLITANISKPYLCCTDRCKICYFYCPCVTILWEDETAVNIFIMNIFQSFSTVCIHFMGGVTVKKLLSKLNGTSKEKLICS